MGNSLDMTRFHAWCDGLNIKQSFSFVAHQQANDQVEVTNRDIVSDIRARLGTDRKGWVDELPMVLWAFQTTPKGSNWEKPFSLVYGSEAVILAKIAVPTQRITEFNEETNEIHLWENFNFLGERRRIQDLGKLGPNWDGPYEFVDALGNGVCNLKTPDGKFVPRTWHATNLKKFYALCLECLE
ncbi:uncharacterized protein [Rutidosis leptorrhynchoides]|uniref:uncharacterized protein n=1 Tax=Rutidosis leptorrhynchoides TaxID=125765 RepID=UPI003A98EBDB